jgi:hypothetical protein
VVIQPLTGAGMAVTRVEEEAGVVGMEDVLGSGEGEIVVHPEESCLRVEIQEA